MSPKAIQTETTSPLKQAREALGLTMEQAAALVGATAKTVMLWEQGRGGRYSHSESYIRQYIAALATYATEQAGKLAELDLRPETLRPDLFAVQPVEPADEVKAA